MPSVPADQADQGGRSRLDHCVPLRQRRLIPATRGPGRPRSQTFVPAAGRAAFTRLYDPAIALTMRERAFRGQLLQQVKDSVPPGGTIVDVGCGTGTFALAAAQAIPAARVVAVDPDEEVLAIARRKPGSGRVEWETGVADRLPLPDDSVDAVTMSLVLHHLEADGKRSALDEARRVLRPGAALHVADWGRPHDPVMRAAFFALQLLDGFPNTRDHVAGRLPSFLRQARFGDVRVNRRLRTLWGTLELLEAR